MPDAGIPQEFNITLEQMEHVVHLFMSAEFADGFVTPRIVGVWGTGGGLFQVELEFDKEELHVSPQRTQLVQVWTTLGDPADGPCTVFIKEARSRVLLKVIEFTRVRQPVVASNPQVALRVQHLLGDIRIGMVANDLLQSARFYAPQEFNDTPGASYWPVRVELRVRAESAITNLNVDLTSIVPGLSVTPISPQAIPSLSAGEEFVVLFRLEAVGLAVGVHNLSYDVSYDTPTGSLSGILPFAVLDVGTVAVDALTVSTTATAPWAYKAGTFTLKVSRREPVEFPGGIGIGKVTLWGFDQLEYPDLDIPVGELGSFSAVGATDNVGPPPAAAVDAAGAVVMGGIGAIKNAVQGKDVTLKDTAVNAAVGAGVATSGVVRAVAQGIAAAAKFVGNLFSGSPKVFYEPGTLVYENHEYHGTFAFETVGETQVSVAVLGKGDPYPGSPLGSNVLSSTAIPF